AAVWPGCCWMRRTASLSINTAENQFSCNEDRRNARSLNCSGHFFEDSIPTVAHLSTGCLARYLIVAGRVIFCPGLCLCIRNALRAAVYQEYYPACDCPGPYLCSG